MTDKCKTRSTWGIYANGIKTILKSPFRLSAKGAAAWAGCLWLLIGWMSGWMGLVYLSFPLNLVVFILGFFIVFPLGVIHFWENLEGTDC